MVRIIFHLVFFLLIFAGCKKSYNNKGEESIPIYFKSDIVSPKKKVYNSRWEEKDLIGIYITSNSPSFIPISNKVYKVGNITTNIEGFSLADLLPLDGENVYYPLDGENVHCFAYYPYSVNTKSNIYLIDVSSEKQIEQNEIDLLYSKKSGNKNNPNINLEFYHQLTKIEVIVKLEKGLNLDLSELNLIIKGMPTYAEFDLNEGKFSDKKNITDIVALTEIKENKCEAIIIPMTIEDHFINRKFIFELKDGSKFTYSIPNDLIFNSNTKYIFDATLSRTSVTMSGTIIPWIERKEDIFPK